MKIAKSRNISSTFVFWKYSILFYKFSKKIMVILYRLYIFLRIININNRQKQKNAKKFKNLQKK